PTARRPAWCKWRTTIWCAAAHEHAEAKQKMGSVLALGPSFVRRRRARLYRAAVARRGSAHRQAAAGRQAPAAAAARHGAHRAWPPWRDAQYARRTLARHASLHDIRLRAPGRL